jgi:hypothetical protein
MDTGMDTQTFTFAVSSGSRTSGQPRSNFACSPQQRIGLIEIVVVPRITGWIQRLSFQKLALAPLDTLLPGSSTRRRELVARLKLSLQQGNQALCDFLDQNAGILEPVIVSATRRMHRAACGLPSSGLSLADLRNGIASLSARLEEEWVSADDYFEPSHNVFVECEDGKLGKRGEFIIELSDELQHVGNYVARCLLIRAKLAVDQLASMLDDVQVGLVAAKAKSWPDSKILGTPKHLSQSCDKWFFMSGKQLSKSKP